MGGVVFGDIAEDYTVEVVESADVRDLNVAKLYDALALPPARG
jgi:hypothetical protein